MTDATVPAGGSGRWWLLAGLWLVYFSFGLSVTSLAPLVGVIIADLGISHSAMGSIMGAWQLVYIFAAVPCGVLLDRLGGRRALLLGALVISLSAAGRAVADDYLIFLLAVMLFGVGGPIISSGAPKVVAQLFTGGDRGFAMGIYMTGPAIGGVVSLTLTNAVLLPWLGDWRAVGGGDGGVGRYLVGARDGVSARHARCAAWGSGRWCCVPTRAAPAARFSACGASGADDERWCVSV